MICWRSRRATTSRSSCSSVTGGSLRSKTALTYGSGCNNPGIARHSYAYSEIAQLPPTRCSPCRLPYEPRHARHTHRHVRRPTRSIESTSTTASVSAPDLPTARTLVRAAVGGALAQSGDAVAQNGDEERRRPLEQPQMCVWKVGELGDLRREQGSVLHRVRDGEALRLDSVGLRPREAQRIQPIRPDVRAAQVHRVPGGFFGADRPPHQVPTRLPSGAARKASPAPPGSTDDPTVARTHGAVEACAAAVSSGGTGGTTARTPRSAALANGHGPLKGRQRLRKLRCRANRITAIVQGRTRPASRAGASRRRRVPGPLHAA